MKYIPILTDQNVIVTVKQNGKTDLTTVKRIKI